MCVCMCVYVCVCVCMCVPVYAKFTLICFCMAIIYKFNLKKCIFCLCNIVHHLALAKVLQTIFSDVHDDTAVMILP